MAGANNQWNDERMDRIISRLLRTGVLLASAVVLAGGILYLIHHGGIRPDYHSFHVEPAGFTKYRDIFRGLHSSEGRNWIQFGVLLLVLTPVARVAFSVFAFFEERDWRYVMLTLIVLTVLVAGLFGR